MMQLICTQLQPALMLLECIQLALAVYARGSLNTTKGAAQLRGLRAGRRYLLPILHVAVEKIVYVLYTILFIH